MTAVIADDILDFREDWIEDRNPSLDNVFAQNTIMIPDVTPPRQGGTVFYDDFEDGLDDWILTSDGTANWESIVWTNYPAPTEPAGNHVAIARECENTCTMTLKDNIDLSGFDDATLNILRNIDRSLDSGEGTTVEISNNGGATWSIAFDFTVNNDADDRIWHQELLELDPKYLVDDFKIRIIGVSSAFSEENIIDNVHVTSLGAGPPPRMTPDQITDFSYSLNDINTVATLSWSTPDGNDHPITSFRIEQIPPGSSGWSVLAGDIAATLNTYAYNVQQGLEYSFRISAQNTHGFGPSSNVVNFDVLDIVKPVIVLNGPALIDVNLDDEFVDPGFTATDNVDGVITHRVAVLGTVDTGITGTYELVYLVSDDAGNRSTAQRTINVIEAITPPDDTDPEITAPDNITAEATGVLTALNIGTATATDNVDSDPTITNDAPASFPLGTTMVTWTATDSAGNHSADTQTVTIQDTTKPVFASLPDDISFQSSEPRQVGFETPEATDIFPVIVSCSPVDGSVFGLGTTQVTCTATDTSGNRATISFSVIIHRILLTITAPPDVTTEATAVLTPVDTGTATASIVSRITSDAPESFPLGDTMVTWTAISTSGQTATATQIITVQDTKRPVFIENPGIIQIRSPVPIPLSYDIPQATDIFPVIVSCSPPPGEGLVEVGAVRIIGCRATDTSGNIASLQIGVGITPPRDSPMKRYGIQDFEIETGETATLHLNTKFAHDGPLIYTITLDNPQIASVEITGQMAVMTWLAQGTTEATACADNGRHSLLCQTFEIRVTS